MAWPTRTSSRSEELYSSLRVSENECMRVYYSLPYTSCPFFLVIETSLSKREPTRSRKKVECAKLGAQA